MADRTLTDTATVNWDFGTPGEAKAIVFDNDDPGEAGQIPISQGPGELPIWGNLPEGGGASVDFQRFNASETWTKPIDEAYGPNSRVHVRVWGGGGGGSGAFSAGAGGGGGGFTERWMLLSELGATETVTIGAGGAAGSGSGGEGGNGGNSTFGAHVTGYGGSGPDYKISSEGGGGGGPLTAGGATAKRDPGLPRIVSNTTGPVYLGEGSTGSRAPGSGIDHGGGGGGESATAAIRNGGSSVNGGGGGAGCTASVAGTGGLSINGGNGGNAGINGAAGQSGTQPGGGGGASETTTGGAGADGRIDVVVYPVAA